MTMLLNGTMATVSRSVEEAVCWETAWGSDKPGGTVPACAKATPVTAGALSASPSTGGGRGWGRGEAGGREGPLLKVHT